MKTLSTDVAAVAIGVDRKILDNVLAREGRKLLATGRRGRSRRISPAALERIAVALILNRDVGVSIARGIQLAERILDSPTIPVSLGSLSALTFDILKLRAILERSTDEALESVAERTRGRPRS